jgi:hypothetical protein
MESKKRTKERWKHRKFRRKKKNEKIIYGGFFFNEFIKAKFLSDEMKDGRKEIIQEILKITDNAITLDNDQWDLWNTYYHEEFMKLLNRKDEWKPTEEFKRIFEHRNLPKKYWNRIGEKVLLDYYKERRCGW